MSADLSAKAPLEKLIEQARTEGWVFFDGPLADAAPRKAQPDERSLRVAHIAAALYQTAEFRELLDFLADQTLHRVTFMPPLVGVDPQQNYAQGCFREGQNALVFMIFKMIAQGRDQTIERRET
jgi:hypothetical protein